jgi:hypothetical protein
VEPPATTSAAIASTSVTARPPGTAIAGRAVPGPVPAATATPVRRARRASSCRVASASATTARATAHGAALSLESDAGDAVGAQVADPHFVADRCRYGGETEGWSTVVNREDGVIVVGSISMI